VQPRIVVRRAAVGLVAVAIIATSCASAPGGGPTVRSLGTRGLVAAAGEDGSRDVVVSPTGAPTGTGTTAHPLDLSTALSARSPAGPDGTLLLRGGVYRGTFVSNVHGVSGHPVVVRSYPGEWAVIDGGTRHAVVLAVRGHDTWVRDLEVRKSDPNRTSSQAGDGPTDQSRGGIGGVWLQAPRTKLVNLVIHDAGDGVGFWNGAVDSEVYGCVIFNNGWLGADRGWGHGMYVQNTTGVKTIADTVLFDNFGFGIHVYNGQDDVRGVHIDGVTSFENGAPSGQRQPNVYAGSGQAAADDISLTNSSLYNRPGASGYNAYFGYPTTSGKPLHPSGSLSIEANRIVGGFNALFVRDWQHAKTRKNDFVLSHVRGGSLIADLRTTTGTGAVVRPTGYAWDSNRYSAADVRSFAFDGAPGGDGSRRLTFNEWRHATGFDGASSDAPSGPAGAWIVVKPNRYERGRAFVTIFNWRRAKEAYVDLRTAGLRSGEPFVVRDVQHLDGPPVYAGTFDARPVVLRLDSSAFTPPIGTLPHSVSHTPIDFGAFLVAPG